MKHIPNLFTLLNLVFGCAAIVFILQNGITIQYGEDGSQFIDIPEKMCFASVCIAFAALVDFLDGFVARLCKATSPLGKQLDSLADVVTFGVAPSMIIYQFLRMSYARDENGINTSIWLLVPAFFIAAAAAYRLAKFNIDDRQQFGFRGVPTPAVGLLIASFPLIYWDATLGDTSFLFFNKWYLYGFIVVISWLMTGEIPMLSFKFKSKKISENLPLLILLFSCILCIIFFKWIAMPLVFVEYILLSLIFKSKS